MVLLCATSKVDISTPSPGSHDNRCFNNLIWRVHEQSVLQGLLARKEGQGNSHKSPGTGDSLEYMSTFREEIKGKAVSFQISITIAVSYLQKEGGTHYRELNGLARKILLSFCRDRVTVCPKFLWE